MPKIFISYRRIDSLERTHRIADWLTLKYGERNVFIDVDRLGGGVDFEDVLQASLEQANVLLIIIGDKWLDELNARLADRQQGKDFVYLEVVQGLQKNIDLVVPVMINNTPFLQANDLPIEMQELTRRQLARVRANPDFHKDMDGIRRIIDQKFWYERAIRYALGFIGSLALIALIAIISISIFREPPPVSDEDAIETSVAQQLTALALPSPTNTPDFTATFDAALLQAIVELSETAAFNLALTEAQYTDTPTFTPLPTNTASPTATITPNASRTARAIFTAEAQLTNVAQAVFDEISTQDAQATANAPTNTPLPTVTNTATVTSTATSTATTTSTATLTATATATIDVSATARAQTNATQTQLAVATQIVQTAQAAVRRVELGRVTIAGALNIRTNPVATSEIVTSVAPGTVLEIIGRNENESWYNVRLPDGQEGWIASEFFEALGFYPENEVEELRNMLRVIRANEDWEPIVHEFDGVPMVLVPSGCFTLGTSDSQLTRLLALNEETDARDEQPVQETCFSFPFWIDQYEVSQAQFAEFDGIAENEPVFSGDDLPQDSVRWVEARDYCRARDATLPSELQWEFAARGPNNFLFPWGNEFETNALNWGNSDDISMPVDDFAEGVSWVGAYQMSGNVWEWTISPYFAYPSGLNFVEDNLNIQRVLRGGSFIDGFRANLRSANRLPSSPNAAFSYYGFRCALLEDVLR